MGVKDKQTPENTIMQDETPYWRADQQNQTRRFVDVHLIRNIINQGVVITSTRTVTVTYGTPPEEILNKYPGWEFAAS